MLGAGLTDRRRNWMLSHFAVVKTNENWLPIVVALALSSVIKVTLTVADSIPALSVLFERMNL